MLTVLHFNPRLRCQAMLQGWFPGCCPLHFFNGACGVGPDLILFLGPVSPLGNASFEGRMSVNPTSAQPTVKPLGSGSQWLNQESCHCAAPGSPFLIQNRAHRLLEAPHVPLGLSACSLVLPPASVNGQAPPHVCCVWPNAFGLHLGGGGQKVCDWSVSRDEKKYTCI